MVRHDIDHYYSEEPKSPLRIGKIVFSFQGSTFHLITASGIFSSRQVDAATRLLIEYAKVPKDARVLDLGCGIGVIGIVIATIHPDTEVVLTDVNKRAVFIAKQNVDRLSLDNAEVYHQNKFERTAKPYDTILLNPPMAAGRAICFEMIKEAKDYLKVGGTLQIVARHNKGGSVLAQKMKEVFGNVEELAKKGGFRVYLSHRT
ncbi:class I SAM-dependent methyltransferase [Candidatus Woesearchaeota archaeon]|nr:MAG: 16S rRNA m(2)G 1207 methyltransferase [archaeon GW2011_AR4]MBS3130154.1 class I SAM-dependent methyltransferase [Candidatus Woesearchaeota archaeon]HIH38985.1 class I SAM-dependent methyltransferase [Candidatus Woesearchaeota archaeon]HIH48804.1 class I SAM-dependent methyltransferase [Candidatus Woesearchaeota archaeon]HIJ04097.1 class I SAM-dependent methyltransferase [Candidatus Woesearchaeota archaeon]